MCAFHSLEVAKQALFVQQSALHTTSHNIANANTKGYTRQRVNFESASAYPAGSRNRPQIPGQIGTGVKAGSVDRIRVDYLDVQYRTENSQNGYWQELARTLGRVESLMNEPSDTGLAATLNDFWSALQDLSVNPDNSGARSVVVQRGAALADTFNYLSETINGFRNDVKQQIDQTALQVNNIIEQIHDINGQISRLEPHGYTTNDLYDKRDLLIDELSGIFHIKVTKAPSADSAPASADGLVTIELLTADGSTTGIKLVEADGESLSFNRLEVEYGDQSQEKIKRFKFLNDEGNEESSIDIDEIELLGNGSMKALYELYNDIFPDKLEELDQMAYLFATEFNKLHREGKTLNGDDGEDFFGGFDTTDATGAAASIEVVIDDPGKIAAAYVEKEQEFTVGNSSNIQRIIDMFDKPLLVDPDDGAEGIPPVMEYYQSIIGELAVQTQQANQMADSTGVLRAQVDFQRQSVSAVSLDEEMTNLIQFQHAYNAAARNITAIDEMLDRIINNMGLVGR